MNKEVLYDIELYIVQQQMDITTPAGNALFTKDDEMINRLKGMYSAYENIRKHISDLYIKQIQKEEEEKAGELEGSYADYVKKQMSTLDDHDHGLFDSLCRGLAERYHQEGGSKIFRLFDCPNGSVVKVFRKAEAPEVISVCFSARPELILEQGEIESGGMAEVIDEEEAIELAVSKNFNFGLVAVDKEGNTLHYCGYELYPTISDREHLLHELRTNKEFGITERDDWILHDAKKD